MPTPEENLFDEFVQDQGLGCRSDPSAYHSSIARELTNKAARARHAIQTNRDHFPRLPLIHFDWIDSPHLGAWAWRHKGVRFIGITTGGFLFLNTLLSRLMSHPEVLPHIGDPSREEASRVTQSLLSLDVSQNFATNVLPITPSDPDRLQYVFAPGEHLLQLPPLS
jgi:hypothetical protein